MFLPLLRKILPMKTIPDETTKPRPLGLYPPKPETTSPDYSTGSESGSPDDLDAAFSRVNPDADEPGPEVGAGASCDTGPGEVMGRDEFVALFIGSFQMGAAFTGLQSLKIEGEETGRAREAASAIYDTALEVPALRWIIQPGNIWMQRALVVLAFTLPKGAAIKAELATRKRPKKPTAAAAPTEPTGGNVMDFPTIADEKRPS